MKKVPKKKVIDVNNIFVKCPICLRPIRWDGKVNAHGQWLLLCKDCPDCERLDKNLKPDNSFFFSATPYAEYGHLPEWEIERRKKEDDNITKKERTKQKRTETKYNKRLNEWKEKRKKIFKDVEEESNQYRDY